MNIKELKYMHFLTPMVIEFVDQEGENQEDKIIFIDFVKERVYGLDGQRIYEPSIDAIIKNRKNSVLVPSIPNEKIEKAIKTGNR